VPADLPTGTVTFLFTDIQGSTRLLHALGANGYANALAEHRRVLREAFTSHGGVEIDTQGDAFFVAFPTAPGAAAAALAGYSLPTRRRAAPRGSRRAPAQGLRRSDASLPARRWRVSAAAHSWKGRLPTPPTQFLGRERELYDAVSSWVEHAPRVLTIVGPGGTGKTRFAIELARLLADEADGATLFVPFAPVHDASLVVQTIADRLGAPSAELSAIASTVGERRTHLVLDNLEHLLPEAAKAIAGLRRGLTSASRTRDVARAAPDPG
jgi:hypothetical protein